MRRDRARAQLRQPPSAQKRIGHARVFITQKKDFVDHGITKKETTHWTLGQ